MVLTYSFTNRNGEALYSHLYKCVREDILKGKLLAGERLPSKRSFAKHLNVSTVTVETAYAQLESEGYIYALPRQGFYVAEVADLMAPGLAQGEEQQVGGQVYPNVTVPRDYFADFVSNRAPADRFPFSVWAQLLRKTISEGSEELLTSPPSGGVAALRSAICDHLRQYRDMHVQPEQVVIGAGTEYLYGLLIQLLGYDKTYAVENPGYQKIAQIYQSNKVAYKAIPMDDAGLSIEELANSRAEIAHVSPSHHYPTGIVTTIGRRYELLGWANERPDRIIIEDDYDSEFRLAGRPIPTLQSNDTAGNVIYMNTFSKSLTSTIRISYMVLPPQLVGVFQERLGFYACTVSNFEQYTLAGFIQEGYFEKHINRMRNYYRGLRDALRKAIRQSALNDDSHIAEEDSGLHFLLKLKTPYSDAELIRRAKEQDIRISCLSNYRLDHHTQVPANVLVVNYSSLEKERIPEAVQRLCRCVK